MAPSDEDFTKGSSKTLVATDVAARGLDVEDITLVVCCLVTFRVALQEIFFGHRFSNAKIWLVVEPWNLMTFHILGME